ncbi:MAG: hypothetical protein JRJ50_09250 [Deltaproteobacteria bacterium]|nr:hypothetical protein [Deltaproteobacteria bacterium]
MCDKIFVRVKMLLWLLALVSLGLSSGCYYQKAPVPEEKPPVFSVRKVVVVGFRAAMSHGEKSDVIRDPLSGGIYMAAPVSRDVVQRMSEVLFDNLVASKKYQLVSPGQAMGVHSRLVDSDQNMGMDTIRILQEVGKTFGCDDLHLIRPTDGAILWRTRFDKTQRSLSENLLDAGTFFQSGGRWLTAEKLAILGLKKVLKDMPGGKK